jgi:hypothetical protein
MFALGKIIYKNHGQGPELAKIDYEEYIGLGPTTYINCHAMNGLATTR